MSSINPTVPAPLATTFSHAQTNGTTSQTYSQSSQPQSHQSSNGHHLPQGSSTHSHSYGPLPSLQPHRPRPCPPFRRVDIYSIKQDLHDVLGENGLPYWKALNGYLLGQISRGEMIGLVRGWFKGKDVRLHNRLLLALLHNASAPSSPVPSPSLANRGKRRRLNVHGPEFDTDANKVEPKSRVQTWIMGITGRERARIRKAALDVDGGASASELGAGILGDDAGPFDQKRKKWSNFAPTASLPPLASSDRQLPSSHQLTLRLAQLAKAYDLTLPSDNASGDLGEFMAVGMDSYLGDILHSTVRMTGHDRPGQDTIRIPRGVKRESDLDTEYDDPTHDTARDANELDGHIKHDPEASLDYYAGELPKPGLETLQYLFTLVPELHQQASPALYKLGSSQTLAEAEYDEAKPKIEREDTPPLLLSGGIKEISGGDRGGTAVSKTMGSRRIPLGGIGHAAGEVKRERAGGVGIRDKTEDVQKHLMENGLLKIDKAGAEGESKKDKKHNLHWKYEDPAMILRDVLG